MYDFFREFVLVSKDHDLSIMVKIGFAPDDDIKHRIIVSSNGICVLLTKNVNCPYFDCFQHKILDIVFISYHKIIPQKVQTKISASKFLVWSCSQLN